MGDRAGRAGDRAGVSPLMLDFLRELDDRGRYPGNMLDRNVRTEYGHLLRIGALTGIDAAERRSLLQTLLSEGRIRSEIAAQFGVKSLASRTHFLSLLYFLGMLTLGASPRTSMGYDLEIPNRVIRELQWEHLALMLEEEAKITIHVDDLRAAAAAIEKRSPAWETAPRRPAGERRGAPGAASRSGRSEDHTPPWPPAGPPGRLRPAARCGRVARCR